jgi:hypothetical protein
MSSFLLLSLLKRVNWGGALKRPLFFKRRKSMLTMAQIRAKSYKVFTTLEPETAKVQESSVKYIEHLGTITGVNVSNWKPLEIFVGEDGKLPSKRNKLNEVFFQYLQACKDEKKTEIPTDDDISKICFKFDKSYAKQIDGIIQRSEAGITDCDKEIASLHVNLQRKHEFRFKTLATVEGLKTKKRDGTGIASDLRKILEEGFWTLSDEPIEGELNLVTPEIVLTHFNKKQATTTTTSVGHIQINVDIANGFLDFWAEGYDKNPLHNSYFHPHVGSDGKICLGNMAKEFELAITNCSLEQSLDIIKKVLTIYCDENPYVHLHSLEAALKAGKIRNRADYKDRAKNIKKIFDENRFTEPLNIDSMVQVSDSMATSMPPGGTAGSGSYYGLDAMMRTSGSWSSVVSSLSEFDPGDPPNPVEASDDDIFA